MELPERMRASVLRSRRDLVIEERPVPQPERGDLLVKISTATVAGADVSFWNLGRNGSFYLDRPTVLGRCASGVVAAVGDEVSEQRLGQRVTIEPIRPCRRCDACHRGHYNVCPNAEYLGYPGAGGVLAEYVAVPADFAHPIPDELCDDHAALIEPMAVALSSLQKAEVGAGTRVLVTGAGPIGLVTVAMAKALGAAEIAVTDRSPERLGYAAALGATHTVNITQTDSVLPEQGYEAFIECSGSTAAVRRGFSAVRAMGHIVLVGRGPDELPIPVSVMQNRELTVRGSWRYANTFPTAVSMAAAKMVDLSLLISGEVGLDGVEAALEQARLGTGVKVLVRPGR